MAKMNNVELHLESISGYENGFVVGMLETMIAILDSKGNKMSYEIEPTTDKVNKDGETIWNVTINIADADDYNEIADLIGKLLFTLEHYC